MERSRRGATSVTIQLAVTQHHGQAGSTQNSTAVFDMRPVSRSRLRQCIRAVPVAWTNVSQRFYIETLGCPKNQVDSDKLVGTLLADGMTSTDDPGAADLVVVNTCAFIEEARKESIETILALDGQRRDGARLVASGWWAGRWGEARAGSRREVARVSGFGVRLPAPPAWGRGRTLIPVASAPLPELDLLNLPRPR